MGKNIRLNKGAWTPEEDERLSAYMNTPTGRLSPWSKLPKQAGLNRCGKSSRLRWMNYLRPGLERGPFNKKEVKLVVKYHEEFGPRWSEIAKKLPGRSDNAIKNYWNTHLKKKSSKRKKSKKAKSVPKPSQPGNLPILILESSSVLREDPGPDAFDWPEQEDLDAMIKAYNEVVIPSKPDIECEPRADDIASVLDFPESSQNSDDFSPVFDMV